MILQWLMNHHHLVDVFTEVVAVCSVLHTFLPPYDWNPYFVNTGLAEFPSAQKLFHAIFNNRWYRFIVYIIGFTALNARSTIWKGAISIGKQLDKVRAETIAECNATTSNSSEVK